MRAWIRTTIVEPFPFFFGHVDFVPGPRPGQDSMSGRPYAGPYYAPRSEWFDLPETRPFQEWRADQLRQRGYTVLVEEVVR